MNLGSIGPDLYYYVNMAQSAKEMLLEGFVDAAGVTPWSYHLHSQKPNQFPLRLSEILFQDALWEDGRIALDASDHRKLAYIAGHLSHIAADQIIHHLVNRIARHYYRDGANRKKHRQCEVFQDYFLYEEVYREKREGAKGKEQGHVQLLRAGLSQVGRYRAALDDEEHRGLVPVLPPAGFRGTYGVFPTEDDIEDSVDNLLLVLRVCKVQGPYKEAQREYEASGAKGDMYREYIAEPDYLAYYGQAVRLSAAYLAALYEVYTTLAGGQDFDDPQKRRFRDIVSDADLSCPLEKDILPKARDRLVSGPGGAKYEPLFPDWEQVMEQASISGRIALAATNPSIPELHPDAQRRCGNRRRAEQRSMSHRHLIC
jgi:hypothetical protein